MTDPTPEEPELTGGSVTVNFVPAGEVQVRRVFIGNGGVILIQAAIDPDDPQRLAIEITTDAPDKEFLIDMLESLVASIDPEGPEEDR